LEEDKTDAPRRIIGNEKSRMKRNNVKPLSIRKDYIKMDLKKRDTISGKGKAASLVAPEFSVRVP